MLNRAGDAEADVDAGSDGLARLPDLARDAHPSRIDSRARGGDFTAKKFRKPLELGKVLRLLQAPSACDKHFRRRNVNAIRERLFLDDLRHRSDEPERFGERAA